MGRLYAGPFGTQITAGSGEGGQLGRWAGRVVVQDGGGEFVDPLPDRAFYLVARRNSLVSV